MTITRRCFIAGLGATATTIGFSPLLSHSIQQKFKSAERDVLYAMNLEAESPFITEAGNGYWLAHPGKSWSQLTFVSPTGFVTRARLRNLPA